jgi:hypothetical protein
MSRKRKQKQEVLEVTQMETIMEQATEAKKETVTYNNKAYSMFQRDGKYHVVCVNFNDKTLEAGVVEIIESNTDQLIISERLQVLLFNSEIL